MTSVQPTTFRHAMAIVCYAVDDGFLINENCRWWHSTLSRLGGPCQIGICSFQVVREGLEALMVTFQAQPTKRFYH